MPPIALGVSCLKPADGEEVFLESRATKCIFSRDQDATGIKLLCLKGLQAAHIERVS